MCYYKLTYLGTLYHSVQIIPHMSILKYGGMKSVPTLHRPFLFRQTSERRRPIPKKKLEELNLLDDFLFGTMVSHPRVGEDFVRILLRIIFNRDFGNLTVVPQKTYYGNDTDLHDAPVFIMLSSMQTA